MNPVNHIDHHFNYWLFVFIGGGLLQVSMYGTYFSPQYRVMDTFTKALVESAIAAVIMLFVYPCMFSCHEAVMNRWQRLASGLFVASFIVLTAMRTAIPTWFMTLIVLTPAIMESRFKGCSPTTTVMLFILLAALVSATTTSYFLMAMLGTDAGEKFWGKADSATSSGAMRPTEVLAGYCVIGVTFTLSLLMLHAWRSPSIHVSHMLRDGTLIGFVFILAAWLLSFAPGLSLDNVVRFGASQKASMVTEVVLVHMLTSLIKLCLASLVLEAVKRSLGFSMGASIALPYIFLIIAMASLPDGLDAPNAAGGVILTIGCTAFAVWMEKQCANKEMDIADYRCRECLETKTVFGLFRPPGACMRRAKEQMDDAKQGKFPMNTLTADHRMLNGEFDGDEDPNEAETI